MSKRNFDEWLGKFRPSISSYDYYIDFAKVISNVEEINPNYSRRNLFAENMHMNKEISPCNFKLSFFSQKKGYKIPVRSTREF